MKTFVIFLTLLLSIKVGIFAQEPIKYYRVDSVKTIKGEVINITSEKSYHKRDFTVIYLKEKKSGEIYRVEVSPEWFFNMDLMKGSKIEVTGSHCRMEDDTHLLMTRSITFQGEIYQFRDKYGFPLWRGKGKYMKPGDKGGMRRRGRH
jgi:hypothetical protein